MPRRSVIGTVELGLSIGISCCCRCPFCFKGTSGHLCDKSTHSTVSSQSLHHLLGSLLRCRNGYELRPSRLVLTQLVRSMSFDDNLSVNPSSSSLKLRRRAVALLRALWSRGCYCQQHDFSVRSEPKCFCYCPRRSLQSVERFRYRFYLSLSSLHFRHMFARCFEGREFEDYSNNGFKHS